MKKVLALLISVCLLVSLAACSENSETTDSKVNHRKRF